MSGPALLMILLVSIAFIVVMTARYKMNAFLVLILAAFGVGLACGLPVPKILDGIKDGFGSTMRAIGIIIVEGTMIGIILEKTGAAVSMANWILKIVGKNRATVAMGVSGYVVGMPLFCDTGFVVMSPLNKALANRSGISMAVMAVILSTALYSTHCLVPPHPGPTAAVGILGVDIGKVILLGLPLAIPGALAGYFWSTRFGKRYDVPAKPEMSYEQLCAAYGELPRVWRSFLPIILPIFLIALKSITTLPGQPISGGRLLSFINFIGDPITALLIGVFLALSLVKNWSEEVLDGWLAKALGSAGLIIIITAGGGAFGNILRISPIGNYLGSSLSKWGIGLFLPFILAAALKIAQGSSTVAIITTSSLIAPMIQGLGLATGWGPVLTVLATGAGGMVVSHANDSYFWVVAKFSDLDVPTAYKVHTSGTLVEGIVTMVGIWVVSLFLH